MNKVYRIIYNETTGTWAAVSEITPGRRKSGRNNTIALTVTAAAVVAAGTIPDEAVAAVSTGGARPARENAIAIGQHAQAPNGNAIAIGTNSKIT